MSSSFVSQSQNPWVLMWTRKSRVMSGRERLLHIMWIIWRDFLKLYWYQTANLTKGLGKIKLALIDGHIPIANEVRWGKGSMMRR
jgi:hypothetical protein